MDCSSVSSTKNVNSLTLPAPGPQGRIPRAGQVLGGQPAGCLRAFVPDGAPPRGFLAVESNEKQFSLCYTVRGQAITPLLPGQPASRGVFVEAFEWCQEHHVDAATIEGLFGDRVEEV